MSTRHHTSHYSSPALYFLKHSILHQSIVLIQSIAACSKVAVLVICTAGCKGGYSHDRSWCKKFDRTSEAQCLNWEHCTILEFCTSFGLLLGVLVVYDNLSLQRSYHPRRPQLLTTHTLWIPDSKKVCGGDDHWILHIECTQAGVRGILYYIADTPVTRLRLRTSVSGNIAVPFASLWSLILLFDPARLTLTRSDRGCSTNVSHNK